MNLFLDSRMDDEKRRQELYRGSVLVYSQTPGSLKLCQFARDLIEEAFRPFDPLKLHENMPVERCVEILAELKPKFIHHAKSKEFIREMLDEKGCGLDKTYFDVPRLRSAFPSEYLASGIAYAFHPHRDTWYSAPSCQINWWMPVYEIFPENCMAFHPRYWDEGVANSSSKYNYYEWNKSNRQSAAQHIKADTREQPRPQVPLAPDPQLRIVANVASPMLFSAAQLHSTVPNTCGLTRFSIDFRTVHLDDVWSQAGAPNVDSASTGTTMRDYIRASDYSHLPEEAIAPYCDESEAEFVPSPTTVVGTNRQ